MQSHYFSCMNCSKKSLYVTCFSLSISYYNTLPFKVPTVTVIVTCLLNLDNKIFFTPSVDRSVCLFFTIGSILINQCDRYSLEKPLGQITMSSCQCFN